MDQNLAALSALQEYVKIEKPRYAFMIEAPWGAGKTHLVKREFRDDLSSDKARYVTLNGVSDRRSFRRALLVDTSEAKLIAAAGKLGDALGKIAKAGNIGSLVQDAVEDRMIDNLPDLLIFDDVERCEMSSGELLGLINEFVEHQAKNVVLCAFIERDDAGERRKNRDDFLSRKEKVVGRTVKIVADAHNALPEFLSSMPDGYPPTTLWAQEKSQACMRAMMLVQNMIMALLLCDLKICVNAFDEALSWIYSKLSAVQTPPRRLRA